MSLDDNRTNEKLFRIAQNTNLFEISKYILKHLIGVLIKK